MLDMLRYILIISFSTGLFLMSVLITIRFVLALRNANTTKDKITSIMYELIIKYGLWWASTLIAVMVK